MFSSLVFISDPDISGLNYDNYEILKDVGNEKNKVQCYTTLYFLLK